MGPAFGLGLRLSLALGLGLALLGTTACGSFGTFGDDTPTFQNGVGALISRHCTNCHFAWGIAPFALDSYESVAPRAREIAFATRNRIMPPFGVDNSGACNTYTGARWLTDGEIELLQRWAEAGAPLGDEPMLSALELRPSEVIFPLVNPNQEVDIGAFYEPSRDRPDDYRCFVVDIDAPDPSFLTGFVVRPSDSRIVHHMILYALASEESEARAIALDAADPGLGYTCFGGPGTNDIRFLAGWAPGVNETKYPAGTGIEVPPHRKAVLQVHYHTIDEVVLDRTQLGLELTAAVDLPAIVLPLADLEMQLAPGMKVVSTTVSVTLQDPPDVDIYGVFPHMHTLGRKLRVEREHGGEGGARDCLVDVPRWSFDWQQFYFYQTPIRVEVGDRATLTCTYDTSTRASVTTWGEGTDDEMCLAGFYIVKK